MLPLALIMRGLGHSVSGSDRSYDQGRTPEKFAYLKDQGIELHPQDGSAVYDGLDAVIVSTAVEDSIPDVKTAKDKGIPILKRADLLAQNFNEAKARIAVGGTSGKSTVTGMIGYILQECGKAPTVMNGGVFRNYKDANPYCSALVGDGGIFVTEADESDGSIALYNPTIAVLNNIALDHKSMEELEVLFGDFIGKAQTAILNADHPGVMALKAKAKSAVTFGITNAADLKAENIELKPEGCSFTVEGQAVNLSLPGEHNIYNALAAIAVCRALGVELPDIAQTLSGFKGIWRRMEVIGHKNGITVIDDFAHNPDKVAASLKALKHFPGRLLIFFQPHGYGFLKLTWEEMSKTFAGLLSRDDKLYLVEPYYAGGTVDRSVTSADMAKSIPQAAVMDGRDAIKTEILNNAKADDRIVIMGARDDTLAEFAEEIYAALP